MRGAIESVPGVLLIGVCATYARLLPAAVIVELVGVTVLIIGSAVLTTAVRGLRIDFSRTLGLAAVGTAGTLITAAAIASLPEVVTQQSVWQTHLGPYYRLLHYGLIGSMALMVSLSRISMVEAAVWAAVTYGALNGGFFALGDERFFLLSGILLVGVAHLPIRRDSGVRVREIAAVEVMTGLFLGCALLATVTAQYVHYSAEMLMRLGTGALAFVLLSRSRDAGTPPRTVRVMLTVAVVLAVAGLHGVWNYAQHASAGAALRARLSMASMHPNAVGIYAATIITLALGALRARSPGGRITIGVAAAAAVASVGVSLAARAGVQLPSAPAMRGIVPVAAAAGVIVVLGALFALVRKAGWAVGLAHGAAVFSAPILMLTYSRSAAAGLLAGLAVLGWAARRGPLSRQSAWRRVLPALVTAGALIVVAGALVTLWGQQEASWRRNVWRMVADSVSRRPFLGRGLGDPAVMAFYDPLPRGLNANQAAWAAGAYPDPLASPASQWHSHNLFLQVFESAGAAGLVVFLGMVAAAAVLVVRGWSRSAGPVRGVLAAIGAAMVSLLIPHQLVLSLSAPSLLPLEFWLLLGLAAATVRLNPPAGGSLPALEAREERLRSVRGRPLVLSLTVITVMLVCVVRPMLAGTLVRTSIGADKCMPPPPASPARIEMACRLMPLNAELRALSGDLAGDADALRWYRDACRLRPRHPAYHVRLGWRLWGQQRLEEALGHFEEAVRIQDETLGRSLSEAFISQRAQDLTLATWVGPNFREHMSDLALAYVATGRGDEAVTCFLRAMGLSADPINPIDWVLENDQIRLSAAFERFAANGVLDARMVSIIEQHTGQGAAAEKPRTSGGSIGFSLLASRYMAGAHAHDAVTTMRHGERVAAVYERWGLPEEAFRVLSSLVDRLPGGSRERAHLQKLAGIAALGQKRPEESENILRACLAGSDGAKARALLAASLTLQGRREEAIRELELAALSWDPGVPADGSWWQVWHDLAQAQQQAGRIPDAARSYAMAHFLLMPTQTYAERLLGLARTAYGQADYSSALRLVAMGVTSLQEDGSLSGETRRLLGLMASETRRNYRRMGIPGDRVPDEHGHLVPRRGCVREAYWALVNDKATEGRTGDHARPDGG
ncbi:MAG: O-antigen ligase family protein [Candidatus Eisenbacteria bacterium]|jgi:tetratricopeptide (TPR) repeat protein|nr:O-antigen ligase family protein [Candidatus Eisenbacteria bacterium]